MARWLLTFQAIDPKDCNSTWEIGIPEWLYRMHQNKGNEQKLARIAVMDEVLQGGTLRLYKGWARLGKEECYVYEGRPERDFRSLTISVPAPPNMAFLVFVLPDGTIDAWGWRSIKQDGGNQVDGIAGDLIWSKNPK